VPKLLEEIAMRCLEKAPDKRFDTMADVVRMLQQDWRLDLMR